MKVLVAVVAAIVIGIAIAHVPVLVHAADYLTPIGTLWVNAIRMTVIPLIVSLLITGVASANDLRAVGRIGGRTIVVFLALLAGVAIVVMPIFLFLPTAGRVAAPPVTDVPRGEAPTFATFLVSLLPTNPVAAAANGEMMPLVLFTLLLALAIAKSRKREPLIAFFAALADAMLILVRWIVWLAPAGVFALVLPLAAHAGVALAGAIGFYIAAYSIACVLVIVLLTIAVAIVARISLRRFARAALPPQLIAFGTSSSIAALPSLVEAAERDLELPEDVVDFVLPLAASTFKIAAPLSWTVGAYFAGSVYGIHLGAGQLATIAFAALFLAFAVPGVPRGAFIMLAPLFVAIGLPVEGIGILIAVDAIPDTFASALNATGHLVAATIVARGPFTARS